MNVRDKTYLNMYMEMNKEMTSPRRACSGDKVIVIVMDDISSQLVMFIFLKSDRMIFGCFCKYKKI